MRRRSSVPTSDYSSSGDDSSFESSYHGRGRKRHDLFLDDGSSSGDSSVSRSSSLSVRKVSENNCVPNKSSKLSAQTCFPSVRRTNNVVNPSSKHAWTVDGWLTSDLLAAHVNSLRTIVREKEMTDLCVEEISKKTAELDELIRALESDVGDEGEMAFLENMIHDLNIVKSKYLFKTDTQWNERIKITNCCRHLVRNLIESKKSNCA